MNQRIENSMCIIQVLGYVDLYECIFYQQISKIFYNRWIPALESKTPIKDNTKAYLVNSL